MSNGTPHEFTYTKKLKTLTKGYKVTPIDLDPADDLAEEVFYRCLDKGLSFKISMGNVLTFTPPLILTKSQMDFAIETISNCLGKAEKQSGK